MNEAKEKRIKKELTRLKKTFIEIEKDKKSMVEKLIQNAAFMATTLEDLQEVINIKGCVEEYQNGANQKGFKKTSEVEVYNAMIKNYSTTIKQLSDLIPKGVAKVESDGFDEFVSDRND